MQFWALLLHAWAQLVSGFIFEPSGLPTGPANGIPLVLTTWPYQDAVAAGGFYLHGMVANVSGLVWQFLKSGRNNLKVVYTVVHAQQHSLDNCYVHAS